jgi:hypothetical protein
VPVTAPIKPVPNSSSTSLIKRVRGEEIKDNLVLHLLKAQWNYGTGSFGTIN